MDGMDGMDGGVMDLTDGRFFFSHQYSSISLCVGAFYFIFHFHATFVLCVTLPIYLTGSVSR